MIDELLTYYNNELAFLREQGAEFAEKYPRVAARLLMEADKCEDPHVERILEGVAFLTARIRRKIDDEYPEITDSLLSILDPHSQRPLPSMSIVQLVLNREGVKLTSGFTVPRGSRLNSRPVAGVPCRFQTAYPVTLWPIEVEAARLDPDRVVFPGKPPEAVALLQLTLRCPAGASFSQLQIDRLRFHLDGAGPVPYTLHELLLNNVCGILVRGRPAPDRPPVTVSLPPRSVLPVGFDRDEGMLPGSSRSFVGYRLLQEYFAIPEKFLFVDVAGLKALAGLGFGDSIDLLFFLDRSPRHDLVVHPENFRLGCTPVVNLFSMVAEPIPLSQVQTEYRVVPDVHRTMATEVFSIDEVTSTGGFLDEPVTYEPFYSSRHARPGQHPATSWYASRRPSGKKDDPGTEVYLSFVDRGFNPRAPAAETMTVHVTCTNRDLPSRLPFGGEQGDFELEAQGPISRVRCLRKPTRPLRPPLGRDAQWRLISRLALNHLSLTDDEHGLDALRELLLIEDYADSAVSRQQIGGITAVSSRRTAGRTGRKTGNAVCLGVEVMIEFDESQYVGSGAFLMASVLERFLGLYASINSFTQLTARTKQREGILKRWPPPRRRQDPPLVETLFQEPFRFDFFQAVRLLHRLDPDRVAIGRDGPARREVARFATRLSLSFPPSSIHELERPAEPGDPPPMTVTFMGLTGPSGVLPLFYTKLLMERRKQGDRTLATFLDLLNHRLVSLFYRAWEKYRVIVPYERGEDDRFSRSVFHLIGLGTRGLRHRHDFPDESLLFYAGHFARRRRPVVVLEDVLRDAFGQPVEVQQFVGQWLRLAPADFSIVGASGVHNELGVSMVLGARVWDEQGKFRLRVGPLTFARFREFLPGGASLRPMAQMARLFVDAELDFDVQLVLKADEVPDCRLSSIPGEGACLGRYAWLKRRTPGEDVDDAVFAPGV